MSVKLNANFLNWVLITLISIQTGSIVWVFGALCYVNQSVSDTGTKNIQGSRGG